MNTYTQASTDHLQTLSRLLTDLEEYKKKDSPNKFYIEKQTEIITRLAEYHEITYSTIEALQEKIKLLNKMVKIDVSDLRSQPKFLYQKISTRKNKRAFQLKLTADTAEFADFTKLFGKTTIKSQMILTGKTIMVFCLRGLHAKLIKNELLTRGIAVEV